ncbi:MAG: GNAT family N-acetyltransferase [Candidatus Methanoperedens sp.]|nr:GNAT family N-acetyltransferase [Candidatus Methanoperedens sp.]
MDIKIRKATYTDIKDIKKILSFFFLDTDNVEKNLAEFIVAQNDLKILGCACLDVGNIVELRSIAILPAYRNKGIGSKLVKTILERAKELTDVIFLRTTSPVFFEKKGFVRLENNDKKVVWKDCEECNKFDICRQTMMKKDLSIK